MKFWNIFFRTGWLVLAYLIFAEYLVIVAHNIEVDKANVLINTRLARVEILRLEMEQFEFKVKYPDSVDEET